MLYQIMTSLLLNLKLFQATSCSISDNFKSNSNQNCLDAVSDAEKNQESLVSNDYNDLDSGFFFKVKPKSQPGSAIQKFMVQLANSCNQNTAALYLLTASGKNAENINFFFNGSAVLDFVSSDSDEESLIFFKRLGLADKVKYIAQGNQQYTVNLYSDILKNNNLFTTQGKIDAANIEDINTMSYVDIALTSILMQLKQSANTNSVSSKDITNIAVAAFLKEMCKSNFKVSTLSADTEGFCFSDYFNTVQTCIDVFYAFEVNATFNLCQTIQNGHFAPSCNFFNIAQTALNQQAGQENNARNRSVCHEIETMFSELDPCYGLQHYQLSTNDCQKEPLAPVTVEDKKKMTIKTVKQAAVKTNSQNKKKQIVTSTKSSTTIWYAAGGVVAISIAVAVYIFVL